MEYIEILKGNLEDKKTEMKGRILYLQGQVYLDGFKNFEKAEEKIKYF